MLIGGEDAQSMGVLVSMDDLMMDLENAWHHMKTI